LPNLPGSASLAALGAASIGVNYVKASLYGSKTEKDAVYFMQSIVKSVKDYDKSIKVVAAGYADAIRIGSVNPLVVPKIAYDAGCDYAMLDTAIKDGKNLFDFLNIDQLKSFVDQTHNYGLKAALAGSLKRDQLVPLCNLNVDIIGVRGAACTGGDRLNGRITRKAVAELIEIVKNAQTSNNAQK